MVTTVTQPQSGRDVAHPSRSLGKLILQYVPGQILPGLITFAAVPVLTRTLGADGYGYYVLAFSLATSMQLFGYQWVSNCALRMYRPMADRRPVLYLHLFASLVLTTALVALLALVLWPWLPDKYRGLLLWIGPLIFLMAVVQTLNSVLRAQGKALWYSLMAVLNAFMRYGPGLAAMALAGWTVTAFLAGWTSGILVNAAMLTVLTGAAAGLWHARLKVAILKEFVVYGMPIMLTGIATVVLMMTDKLFLDVFRSQEEVGFYGAAMQLGGQPIQMLGAAIMLAVFPTAVDAFEGDDNYGRIVERGLRYLILGAAPVLTVLWMAAEPLLAAYAGPGFSQAGWALRLLSLALLLQAVAHYYRMPFMIHRRTGKLILIGGISAAVNVGANFLLIPQLGITGSGIALLVSYGVTLVVSIAMSRKLNAGCWPLASTLRATAVAVVVGAAGWLVVRQARLESMSAIAVAAVMAMIVCVAGLYVSGEIRAEVHQVFREVRRRLRRSA